MLSNHITWKEEQNNIPESFLLSWRSVVLTQDPLCALEERTDKKNVEETFSVYRKILEDIEWKKIYMMKCANI